MVGTYRVLADVGFDGLTTQRVADAADCSQSLVHYHYDTKEDLVVAFLEWVREAEGDYLEGLGEGSAEDRLRAFVDLQLSIPRDDEHGWFNVAFLELQTAAARNDRYRDALREFTSMVDDVLVAVIEDGVETGEFRDVDPRATARFLRYALHGAVGATLTLHEDATEAVRAPVEAYLEGVVLAETD